MSVAEEKRRGKHRTGFVWSKGGRVFVQRCPECLLENYGPAVATGACAWCGWSGKEAPISYKEQVSEGDMWDNEESVAPLPEAALFNADLRARELYKQ